MNLIETTNLTKKYGQQFAVRDLNLKVPAGELTAYLGTNGAGKSTTIRMLTQTLTPSSGKIHYLDHKKGGAIGVVFQTSVLDPELTVMDNLQLRGSMYPNVTKQQIISLLEKIGISSFEKKEYGKLSGGMRRKVDIARALIHQPDLLFLDEPTTGLDPKSREEIWQLLHELKQNGLGIFLTTHYLEEADFADYIYILEKGQILEEGTPDELKEKYRQLKINLISQHIPKLEEQVKKYTITNKRKGSLEITLSDNSEVIPLLLHVRAFISDFSYQPIGMNDVFLKVTGRGIE